MITNRQLKRTEREKEKLRRKWARQPRYGSSDDFSRPMTLAEIEALIVKARQQ